MIDEMWSKALPVRSECCGLMCAGILNKGIATTPLVSPSASRLSDCYLILHFISSTHRHILREECPSKTARDHSSMVCAYN
jgi:hypothetical protein